MSEELRDEIRKQTGILGTEYTSLQNLMKTLQEWMESIDYKIAILESDVDFWKQKYKEFETKLNKILSKRILE